MAVPDFSKIWASQSPLTPYEFDDEDYLDGWEFIGEIPPDRRMLDTLQKQNDTKLQWLFGNAAYLIRKNSTEYEKGDIAFSRNLASALVLECVKGGITAAAEPDFSGATVGATVEDGTVKWRYQPLIGGNMPLGAVAPFLQTSIPDGWLSLENGQLVLRSAYPELWAWVQQNAPLITDAEWQTKAAAQKSVGYYSSGDGSTTFRLPRLIGFMEGTTAANVGAFTGAGLPNITGSINTTVFENGSDIGAYGTFSPTTPPHSVSAQMTTYANPSYTPDVVSFNAALSSAIYGNSDTVQPESVGMVWCVRAFGAATNQGTVDITELAQMLNLKQDKATVRNDAGGIIAASFSINAGYLKFGTTNGVNPIIQWGVAPLVNGANMSVATFPISFTGATTYGITGITSTTVGNANYSKVSSFVSDYERSATSCDFRTSENQDVFYIAIGY